MAAERKIYILIVMLAKSILNRIMKHNFSRIRET